MEITPLESDPGLLAEVNAFGKARQENVARQQADAKAWLEGGDVPTGEGVWNSQYVRAKGKAGREGYERHQTIFKCRDPIRSS